MKKILLSFSLIIFFNTSITAQVAVFKSVAFIDSVSQPGTNKYGLKLSFNGMNVPIMFKTFNPLDGLTYYGDSIPNLYNTTQNFLTISQNGVSARAYNQNNPNELISELNLTVLSKDILSFPFVNSSTSSNCNGEINLNIDTLNPKVHLQYSSLYSTVGNSSWGASLHVSNNYIDSLCSGRYFVESVYKINSDIDTNLYLAWDEAEVFLGQYVFPSITGLNVVVNPYQQTFSPLCDGKVIVSTPNNTLTTMFSFDNGPYTNVDSLTNLCEGMHTVIVATPIDTVGRYFIISNINNTINNINPFGNVIDTIMYNVTNCNFNYNIPIDSAFINNYYFVDSNTVFFSWQIWQLGNSTTISDTITYFYQNGTNMISMMIYCGSARLTGSPSLKTYRINDYISLNQSVGVKGNQDIIKFELYPNPFSSSISIKSTSLLDVKRIEIVNLLGEVLDIKYQVNGQEIVIDTDNVKSGFYTISIISKSGQKSSYKVVKQ